MPKRLAELLLLIGFMVLAVLLYRSTAALPAMVQGSTAMYVRFLGTGLGLLCLYELFVFLRSRPRKTPAAADMPEIPPGTPTQQTPTRQNPTPGSPAPETTTSEKMELAASPRRFWGLLGLLALYAAAFDKLGFYLASALFLPLAMLLLGARKPLTIILTTGGVLLFVYLVFARLLEVPLPPGTLL